MSERPKPKHARVPRLNRIAQAFTDQVDSMDDADLRALCREAQRVSTTNCGWLTYDLAPLADQLAAWILAKRAALAALRAVGLDVELAPEAGERQEREGTDRG